MVYKERPTHLYAIAIVFCTHTILSLYKSQLYLTYILGLNYWSTNTAFILLLLAFFFKRIPSYALWYVVTFNFKLTELTSFFFKKKLISTLIVGTVAIHPFAFYLFTTFFFVKFFTKNAYLLLNLSAIALKSLATFLMSTLILGGFWGLQSLSWGYFWVNDAIEWLLLLKIIHVLRFGHTLSRKRITCNEFLIPAAILSLVVFVRLNLIQTRHNFISSQPLVYTMLVSYALLLTLNPHAIKNYPQSHRRFNLIVLFSVFLVGLGLYLNANISLKYIWVLLLVYYVHNCKPGHFKRFGYLHFLVLTFFTAWLLYFNFFHLCYLIGTRVAVSSLKVYEHALFTVAQYSTIRSLTLLEGVIFSLFDEASHYVNLLQNLEVSVLLNTKALAYILLLIFFVKWVELRFLYKKKAYIQAAYLS